MTNPIRIPIELEEGERIEPAKSGAYLIRRSGQKIHVWYEHAPGDKITCPECGGNGHYWIQTVLLHKERETCSTCKGASAVTVKSVTLKEVECECINGGLFDGLSWNKCPDCHKGKRYWWVIEWKS
jgi:hypothetical protein